VAYVLRKVPREVIREHWGEDVEALERLVRKKRGDNQGESDRPPE
jgi:hypothetical protein